MSASVLFIAPSAYPLGGVAVWLDYLAPALAAHGWTGVAGLVAGPCHDVAAYRTAYPRLPAVDIANPTGSHEGRIRAIEQTLLQHRPDVVVAVNIVDVYAAAQRVRQRGQRIRTVMALHGIAADLLGDLARESTLLDAVIATNRLACRLCVEHAGMPPERVLYAPYGVDVDALGGLARSPRAGTLRVAWVGRLEQDQKRVGDLPAIAAALDRLGVDYVLRVVGNGPERERAMQSLQPWLASGRVVFAGALPAADLGPTVYANTDVLLLTSSWETGPIVIWEAMAAGLAIVTSRYVGTGLEGALRHEQNCLTFPVGDSVQAARLLGRLAIDDPLLEQLARAGRRLVAERYAIDQSVRGWAQCLDAVMRLPERPPGKPTLSPRPAGRLDRLIGIGGAESTRRALGVAFQHGDPGGEWPHTAASGVDELGLLRLAAQLDLA